MTNIKRALKGGAATPVIVVSSANNPIPGATATIGVMGAALLEGDLFSVTIVDASVADGADFDILLVTGTTKVIVALAAATSGDADVIFYEDTTVSDNGSAVSVVNMNRNSAKASNMSAFEAPTVTGVGTELFNVSFPGGEKKDAVPVSAASSLGWYLKPSSNYLLRITNQSGGAQTISALMDVLETEL